MFYYLFLLLFSSSLLAQSTDRIIVKFKSQKFTAQSAHISSDKMATMQFTLNKKLTFRRQMFSGASVFNLEKETSIEAVKAMAKKLALQNDVEYAEPDYRKYPMAFKDEPRYAEQWYLHDATTDKKSAINLEAAWAIEDGSSNAVTVAILDSGYIAGTPDLENQYVAGSASKGGYDFISADSSGVYISAGDGNGRDSNPSDSGSGYTVNKYNNNKFLLSCNGVITEDVASVWHGTFVAGIVAAEANNSDIVGVNPNAKILPLRVLGRCGGYTSDISDAIRWAAGLSVSAVRTNNNPAKIINLSLGNLSRCSTTEQSAITAAYNAGSVVIVAAGNEAILASNSSPANCDNVMAVSAITFGGAETGYTNYGRNVDIAAPGGNNGHEILSLSNAGKFRSAAAKLKKDQGTSFSAPIVAGVASLMLAINPNLTPSQIMGTIKKTASSFPKNTRDGSRDCLVSTCGAGMLNALAALKAVRDDNLTEYYDHATGYIIAKAVNTVGKRVMVSPPITSVSEVEELKKPVSKAGELKIHLIITIFLLVFYRRSKKSV